MSVCLSVLAPEIFTERERRHGFLQKLDIFKKLQVGGGTGVGESEAPAVFSMKEIF